MAFTPIPLTATPKELILTLIKAANPAAELTINDFTLSAPVTVDADTDGRDTSLVVSAVQGSGYSGNQTITYRRIPLADLAATKTASDLTFGLDGMTTSAELVTMLNGLFGINLTAADFVDEELPTATKPNEVLSYTFKAAAGSLIFTGSFVITLNATEDIDLTTVITKTTVDGFVYA